MRPAVSCGTHLAVGPRVQQGFDFPSTGGAPQEYEIVPKLKSHRGAAKRFRLTGTGKVRRRRALKNHILTKKTRKRKRHLRKGAAVSPAFEKAVRRMISV